jgi:ketosteroid isomerase-like protein
MMRDAVTEYYKAVSDHDWVKLASMLSDDVVRMGVRSEFDDDTVRGREPYARFVETIISSFDYHAMEVIGIFYSADGRFACAQTVEALQEPGGERVRLHCLKWHELDGDGLIVKID